MSLYTVYYTLSGDPEIEAGMEYSADTMEGVFAKLERIRGLSSAALYEDHHRIGILRRSTAGIWEVSQG